MSKTLWCYFGLLFTLGLPLVLLVPNEGVKGDSFDQAGWVRKISFLPRRRGFPDRQLYGRNPLLLSPVSLWLFLEDGVSQVCGDKNSSRLAIIVMGFPLAGITSVFRWRYKGRSD